MQLGLRIHVLGSIYGILRCKPRKHSSEYCGLMTNRVHFSGVNQDSTSTRYYILRQSE